MVLDAPSEACSEPNPSPKTGQKGCVAHADPAHDAGSGVIWDVFLLYLSKLEQLVLAAGPEVDLINVA